MSINVIHHEVQMYFCTDLRYIIYISKGTTNPVVSAALPWKGKDNASES